MAITTYQQLRDAIGHWLHRQSVLGQDESTDMIPDIITLGEARIWRELRHRHMETALLGTIASGVIPVPSDYVELKFAYIDGTPVRRLKRRSPSFIYTNYPNRASSGQPWFIAREGTSFIFGPFPDSGYTVKGIYFKRLDPLATSLNAIFTQFPDLWLAAALSEAHLFVQDAASSQQWEGKYQSIMAGVRAENSMEDGSGSTGKQWD